MPRLSTLEDIDFPVKEHPVYVITGEGVSERRIFVRDKKAVVNDNNQRVLGIVSKSYRLVGNAEAIAMAYAVRWAIVQVPNALANLIDQADRAQRCSAIRRHFCQRWGR